MSCLPLAERQKPVVEVPLSDFCNYVDKLVHLQEAQISSTESYAEWIGPIKHRFLVLELQRCHSPKDACLRLDRRGLGILAGNEANDRVRFMVDGRGMQI